jgi:Lar family restriction alleviation protein
MADVCPFCRQAAASVVSGTSGMHVFCHGCGASGPFRYTADDATSAWNTRLAEDALRARIAELEAALTAEKKCHYLAVRLIGERDARLEEAGNRIAELEDLLSQLANAVTVYRTGTTNHAIGQAQGEMAEVADRAQKFLHTGE